MDRWNVLVLAAAAVARAGSAQTATEILQKVSGAYRGTALDIEWKEGYEHQSPASQNNTQAPIRMAQAGAKTRLEEYGMLYVSDGVHNWQYSSAFHEYADNKGMMANLFSRYLALPRGVQNARILREEPLTLQGSAVPCYVIEVERPRNLPGSNQLVTRETYWIDKARYLVLKSTSSTLPTAPDVPGGTSQRGIQVTRVASGDAVPDSLFQFTPPAGAKLVDRISSTPQSPLYGKPFPEFEWTDLQGNPYSTKSLSGHVAVIRFGSFYSDADTSFVELLHRALAPKGVIVWDVITGRTSGLQSEVQRLGYTMPMLAASPSTTAAALGFGNGVLTGVVVLDRSGKVVYHSNGMTGTTLQQDVVTALRDAGVW
ncbi:MAG: redoxin domain-containing protein [Candidatus Sulfopaludibacter sp.]|nr:redoxin domain-containing protein [Candidatus Sulfopaludibacter sp.]